MHASVNVAARSGRKGGSNNIPGGDGGGKERDWGEDVGEAMDSFDGGGGGGGGSGFLPGAKPGPPPTPKRVGPRVGPHTTSPSHPNVSYSVTAANH